MAEIQDIEAPIIDEQQEPTQGDPAEKYYNYLKKVGADTPPTFDSFKKTLSDPKSAQQYYNYLRSKKYDAPPTFESFSKTLGVHQGSAPIATPKSEPTPPPVPEHEIQHTSVHDLRHLQEMANRPETQSYSTGSATVNAPDPEAIASNKAYKDQYEKQAQELSKTWGTDLDATKKAINDFPDEQDENKLKNFATLGKVNPVIYGQLKNENDIRVKIEKDGPDGVHDANVYNHLQHADNYHELTEYNIPLQKEIMAKHGLGSSDLEKYKDAKAPLINTLDPDLLAKYWNGPDKELGLNPSQYAGLETERLFSPNKYQMDMGIIKNARGLDEAGKANPIDLSKQPYEYQRGVENVLYNLDKQGRENTARYIAGQKPQIEAQVKDLQSLYETKINNAKTPQEQQALIQEFNSNPLIAEATKLEQGADELKYDEVNDQRKYPLNFADQATRAVRDAMDQTQGVGTNVGKWFGNVLQGAGESADNTMRWIKNTAINIAGSEESKAFNNAKNIGHQSLNELSAYEPRSYTGVESPFKIPEDLTKNVQSVFNDPSLSSSEKEQKATALVRDNFDQLEVNPKAGQQGLTWKAGIYQAANVMGQILGVANQSFLLGGAIGDASKLQQMATAFTPMYMSTQNQMYEQALKNGDEHPLLKSNLDATIISLASLINPDIKVVKGMLGAESGLGKTIAGISEDTWNKVLSTNKPILDRTIAAAKATGKQLGLANLQYGLVVPTAEAASHKLLFNEDSNLGDKIKDGIIQTSLTMALPAILHGAWGGIKAAHVNPIQKYAIAEAGLHPDLNIELIEGRIKSGEISEIQGHEMKQMVKHAGEILQNSEMVKTDGTPMNEKEVADTVYNMLRVRTLEGKLKNAAGPVKPIIEERIHELNKDIADLHTSESDKQKSELNQLLNDNLDRIKEKMPTMEGPIKDAIARNEPEEVYKEIASQALETTKVDGVEKSSRGLTEEIFGKALVDKAIEISKQKEKPVEHPEDTGIEKPKHTVSTANVVNVKLKEAAPKEGSFLESRHADTMDDERGKVSGPNDNPLSKDGKKDANDLANEVEGKGVTKIITSDLERAKETGRIVSEKTGAKVESRPELNTWDIGDFDKASDAEFKKAQDFFVKNPDAKEFEGKKINESFNEYKDRVIKARTELENEPASTLVVNHSNNMMLWDAFVKNGHEWNEQAAKDYLSAKTPEPATLTNKNIDNASTIRGNQGQIPAGGNEPASSQNQGGQNIQQPEEQKAQPSSTEQSAGQQGGSHPTGEEVDVMPFTEDPGDKSILATNEGRGENVSTKRSINDVLRQRMGLPDVPIPKLGSDTEEMTKAKERIDSGKSNPLNVVDKILNTEDINEIGLSTNDRYDMQYHMLQLKQKGLELNRAMSDVTDKLAENPEDQAAQEQFILLTQQRAQHAEDYIKAATANRIGSAVWGKSGNAMQVEIDAQGIVQQRIQRINDWYGGKLPESVKAKIDEIQTRLDDATTKMQKLQEKYDKKIVENEALKAMKGDGARKVKKTSTEFKSERKEILGDIKEALRKARGDLSSTIVPGVKEFAAIAPHLLKLFKSYAEEGFQKVDEVIDKMFEDVRDDVPGITKKDIHDVLAGNYKETKNPIEKDQEYVKAQQAKANAMMMLRKVEQQAMDSKKNLYMKILDFATQWERRAIFAFNNAVFIKLSSAALLGSTVHKPIEYAVGKGVAKAFPKLAEKAIIEGNENLASLAKFYIEEFNPKKFAEQTWQIYKRGESGLTQELSQKGHTGYTYDKWYHYASPVLDAYTNTHQVIKDPIKRAVMESSMINALNWYKKNGMDPSHPLILEEARQYAYKRAEYEIFQDKNSISSKINSFIGELEKSGIKQANEAGLHNKISGNLKYTGSTLYHMLVPIATVPINITRRASVGALLPYNIIKAYNLENGVKALSSEQSDIVLRQLKKGAIGAAYWTLGLFIYGNAGGLWNKYDPDKKKDTDLKPGRPHADEIKTPFGNIPKGVQHTPQLQSLQYGATMANTYIHYKDELGESAVKALGAGIMAQLGAMIDGVPPAKETAKVIEGLQDPAQFKKIGDDLKRGFGYNKLQDAGILPADDKKKEKGTRSPAHR